jgi:SlyX protein
MSMGNDRIIELEIKAAYQEDLLQALNQIVSQQQQQIDRLENTCRLLNEQLKSLSVARQEGDGAEGGGYEVPPHY